MQIVKVLCIKMRITGIVRSVIRERILLKNIPNTIVSHIKNTNSLYYYKSGYKKYFTHFKFKIPTINIQYKNNAGWYFFDLFYIVKEK